MVAPANGHPHNGHSAPAPSDKRAEANRLNAQKSTGPRTAEGKARSSMNAVKHGLAAQTALLPGEDPAELEALAQSLAAEFRPLGALGAILLQRVVSIAWKLRRVSSAEEAVARDMDVKAMREWREGRELSQHMIGTQRLAGPRPRERAAGELLADCFPVAGSKDRNAPPDGPLVRITHYELKLDAALRASMRELRALRKDEMFSAPQADQPSRQSAPESAPDPATDNAPAPAPDNAPDGAAGQAPPPPSTADPRMPRQPAAAEAATAPGENEPVSPARAADVAPEGGAGADPPDPV